MKHTLKFISIIIFLIFTGCQSSEIMQKNAKKAITNLEKLQSLLNEEKKELGNLKTEKYYFIYKIYEKDWLEEFEKIEKEYIKLKIVTDENINPIIQKASFKNRKKFEKNHSYVLDKIAFIEFCIKKLQNKKTGALSIYNNSKKYVDSFKPNRDNINQLYEKSNKLYLEHIKDDKNKETSLTALHRKIKDLKDTFDKKSLELEKEYDSSNKADEALYKRLHSFYSKNYDLPETIKKYDSTLDKLSNNLFVSYTQILKDQKKDCYLKVSRHSWNPEEHVYDYYLSFPEVKVNETTYNYLMKLKDTPLATKRKELEILISQEAWNMLNIEKPLDSLNESYYADFSVKEINIKYFHKYTVYTDDIKSETDWVEVSKEFYEKNSANKNMALESKPYGTLEEDTLKMPSNPEYNYIGDSRYGYWRRSNGRSYWSWYGKYRFLKEITRTNKKDYSRDDYDNWNKKASEFRASSHTNTRSRNNSHSNSSNYSSSFGSSSKSKSYSNSSVRRKSSSARSKGLSGGK